ncbi:MAG: Asp/Glu racemase [Clostridia bacterium]|nr:Asp/Glu racemase [Clostridia bacterium]
MNDLNYGEKGKIGLIYPSAGWVMEPELNEMAPEGISIQATRVPLGNTDVEGLNKLLLSIQDAAVLLSHIPTDIILLGCTSASFINGLAYEKQMIDEMERLTNIKFTTTSTSVIKALKEMNIKKVAVATPYIDEVNIKAELYLKENNIDVCGMKGMGLITDQQIDGVKLEDVYRFCLDADCEDAEALLILCTGLRTIPIIERLERDLNKPVITAIQASMWNALRCINMKDCVKGFGSLFEK